MLLALTDYGWGTREFEKVLLLLFKANTLADAETLSGKIHCYNFLIEVVMCILLTLLKTDV